jgi:hypothetical protein
MLPNLIKTLVGLQGRSKRSQVKKGRRMDWTAAAIASLGAGLAHPCRASLGTISLKGAKRSP